MKNKNNLYGNHRVYAPDGTLMFFGNNKKVNWYLKRNLAEVIKQDGESMHIRLLFEPNGKGHKSDDPYYLTEKENKCVVSGDTDISNLTKHHIVPYMYRKHFPMEYKSRTSHDLVLMTRKEHRNYENQADVLKKELLVELDIPLIKEINLTEIRPGKLANTILRHGSVIPEDNLEKLKNEYKTLTGLEPIEENFIISVELASNDDKWKSKKVVDYGKLVVEKIDNIEEFCIRWRQHFIDCVNPQHMPMGWSIDNDVVVRK